MLYAWQAQQKQDLPLKYDSPNSQRQGFQDSVVVPGKDLVSVFGNASVVFGGSCALRRRG